MFPLLTNPKMSPTLCFCNSVSLTCLIFLDPCLDGDSDLDGEEPYLLGEPIFLTVPGYFPSLDELQPIFLIDVDVFNE
jgi:hypothetical protein